MPPQTTRPNIGIPVRLTAGDTVVDNTVVDNRVLAAQRVFDTIVALVEASGADAVRLTPDDVEHGALSGCAGFLLPGGGDVNPARYGGPVAEPTLFGVDPTQDALDTAVADFAASTGRPLLAICRGMQLVNVVHGGSLHVDLPPSIVTHSLPYTDHVAWSEHKVDIEPETLCAQSLGDHPPAQVACHHHQAINELGDGLRVSARAADGCIEAIEGTSRSQWLLGVQWHPEADTATAQQAQHALFDALRSAAANYQSQRGEPSPPTGDLEPGQTPSPNYAVPLQRGTNHR